VAVGSSVQMGLELSCLFITLGHLAGLLGDPVWLRGPFQRATKLQQTNGYDRLPAVVGNFNSETNMLLLICYNTANSRNARSLWESILSSVKHEWRTDYLHIHRWADFVIFKEKSAFT
jgi:hypothetical protein